MRDRETPPKKQPVEPNEKLIALLISSVVLVLLVLIAEQAGITIAFVVMIVLVVLILVIGGAQDQLQGTLKIILSEMRRIIRL